MAITDPLNLYRRVSSKTTTSRAGIANVNAGSNNYYIHSGLEISIPRPQATAIVLQPFVIEVLSTEEGYIATSRISTVYELEATAGQAVRSYLESLLDELIWLEQEKERLSPAILEELHLLRKYLQIV